VFKYSSLPVSKWTVLLFCGDLAIFSLSMVFGLYFGSTLILPIWEWFVHLKVSLLVIGLSYFGVFYLADLYDYYQDFRRLPNLMRVIAAGSIGACLTVLLFYLMSRFLIGPDRLIIHTVSFALLITLWRCTFSAIALPMRLSKPVLIVGAGGAGRKIVEALRRCPHRGLAVKGFIDDDPAKLGRTVLGIPVLGDCRRLPELMQHHQAKLLVIAITHDKSPDLLSVLTNLHLNGCRLVDMPGLYESLAKKVPIGHISDAWLFLSHLSHRKPAYRLGKRLFDLSMAALFILLTWPLWVVIMAAIRWDSPGPLFFRQSRLGRDGKPFQIFKFRSMHHEPERSEAAWTVENDPRVTRVGRLLRRTHLDELPQLLNVLNGDMSLIGPRAEWEVFAQQAREKVPQWRPGGRASDPPGTRVLCGHRERLPYYHYRLMVKPGMTGWAQVMHPCAGSSLEDLKEKLRYDLYYIKNMGFFLDLVILLKTMRIVLLGKGK
jgi:exopolysaccharide biosynthesis polyprenyl glycosylphosphotransferase